MRRLIILLLLSLTFFSCSSVGNEDKDNNEILEEKENEKLSQTKPIDSNYQKKLFAIKAFYPFDVWAEGYHDGLTQYSKQNCEKVKKVFDDLIASLVDLGENASEEQKKKLFRTAIIKTNKLNDQIAGLIETDEREGLCALTNKITVACGLDPKKYGDGEGLASEWRDW